MEIRILAGEELERAYYVWSQAFENGERELRGWRDWDIANPHRSATYGLFDESGLQATFMIVDYQIHLGADRTVPMAGVNGVACLPAARGKGYAGLGVKHTFEQMRRRGQAISILEPFSFEFYRKLGYEWIGPYRRYWVPTRILSSAAETRHVRAATADDRSRIIACYQTFAQRYRGALVRGDYEWNDTLNDKPKQHTFTYLYEIDGRVEGYLTFRGGKREETHLREFIALNANARRGLLGLLRRHEMQTDKFVWSAPADDTFWLQEMHDEIETKLKSELMARIVDVKGALEALTMPSNGLRPLRLAVTDQAAPWNNGTWEAAPIEGTCQVGPTSESPDLSLDIQTLTQLYLGTLSVEEARRAGRIDLHNSAALQELETLFQGPPTWINDSF